MKRTALIVLAIALVSVLPAVACAAPPASLHGTVAGSDGPLAGAEVRVEFIGKGGLPRPVATLRTDASGDWSYSGKAGDYRLTVSADGYATRVVTASATGRTDTLVDVTLSVAAPPTAVITGRITNSDGVGLLGYAYFYRADPDGSWPTAYIKQVTTGSDGRYTSGPLPLGVYKVRLFTIHTGVQWYRFAPTMELAAPVTLSTADQIVTGIDAQYPPPTP